MPNTRRISEADAFDSGYPNYRVVMAASPESATVLGCFLGDGGHPPLHVHDVDLFYIVLEGSATIRLGHDTHEAKAGELIYIPAGLPHGSDNQSGAAERHLEIQVPGVRPGAPILKPVGSVDEVQMPSAAPYVTSVSGAATEMTGHERRWALTDESTDVRTARITAAERTGPEVPGEPASRDNDRLIVVTKGQLNTEIAARAAAVPAEAVIVIPAGVPHLIWNSSPAPVRYLDVDIHAATAYTKLAPAA
jgi:quercetin dioxygenase-like cupin family protein